MLDKSDRALLSTSNIRSLPQLSFLQLDVITLVETLLSQSQHQQSAQVVRSRRFSIPNN